MTLVPKHLRATLPGLAPAWQSRHVLAEGDALLSGEHAESVHVFTQQAPVEPLLCVRLMLGCRGCVNVQRRHSLPSALPSPCWLMRPREHAQKAQEEEPQGLCEERGKQVTGNYSLHIPGSSPKVALPPQPTAASECI